jgi:hypothetical protein
VLEQGLDLGDDALVAVDLQRLQNGDDDPRTGVLERV